MEGLAHALNGRVFDAVPSVDHNTLKHYWDTLGRFAHLARNSDVLHLLDIVVREFSFDVVCAWSVDEKDVSNLLFRNFSCYSFNARAKREHILSSIKAVLVLLTVSVDEEVEGGALAGPDLSLHYNSCFFICITADKLERQFQITKIKNSFKSRQEGGLVVLPQESYLMIEFFVRLSIDVIRLLVIAFFFLLLIWRFMILWKRFIAEFNCGFIWFKTCRICWQQYFGCLLRSRMESRCTERIPISLSNCLSWQRASIRTQKGAWSKLPWCGRRSRLLREETCPDSFSFSLKWFPGCGGSKSYWFDLPLRCIWMKRTLLALHRVRLPSRGRTNWKLRRWSRHERVWSVTELESKLVETTLRVWLLLHSFDLVRTIGVA